jgi:hypothetical protein
MPSLRRTHLLILIVLAACGARAADPRAGIDAADGTAAIPEDPPQHVAPLADDTVVDVTAVTLAPDGTTQVRTGKTTVGAQRAARAVAPGSATPLIMQWWCAPTSFSLWDRTDFTGNQICFTGTGTTSLADYSRGALTWQIQSGSWAAGVSYSGLLQQSTDPTPDAQGSTGGDIVCDRGMTGTLTLGGDIHLLRLDLRVGATW